MGMSKQIGFTPAVFLRGVNLGPHKRIEMDALCRVFDSAGYQNVRTILASGNVFFETAPGMALPQGEEIERLLENAFGFQVDVFLRSVSRLVELLQADPFKGILITPQTRFYVTFLSEPPQTSLKIPYENPEKDFRIIRVSGCDVCSVVELSPARGTTEAMKILGKEFGKKITTRNWNTIVKMLKG